MSSWVDALLAVETVSLNHVWTIDSPIFALNPRFNITPAATHTATFGQIPGGLSAGSTSMQFSGQHGAPTIDALGHFAVNNTLHDGTPANEVDGPNGLLRMGIDEYPEDKYINRGLEACIEKENVEMKKGDSVLIRLGWGSLFKSDPARYLKDSAGVSGEVAGYLAEKEVFLTGSDTIGYDVANNPEGYPAHTTLIALNGIFIVENMNLESLSVTCQEKASFEFVVIVNPPKVKGAAGMALNSFAIFGAKDESSAVSLQPTLAAVGLLALLIW